MKTTAIAALFLVILTLPAGAVEKLAVKVVVDPAALYAGDKLTITAWTAPGAVCALTIKFRAGVLQAPTRTANEAGKITWTPETTGRIPQTADVIVSCALEEQKASAAATLTIR